ncbi:Jhy protein like [Dissostichus eleginoides]|uniref:Jhy protein like n=1 Tax=Dissostichus eleginoides TaxID=100907 RepID=A0AAD9BF65_DISEL|nr:Jhy protein like [Dissostichus eleginoides]
MDKDLKNEPTSQGWKTEQEKLPAPRQQWDSVESDTESLAQERAYQQQRHMDLIRHHQNKYTLPQKKKDDSLQPGYQEGEDASDDEALGLQVVDSLDVAAKHRAKRSPTLTQTEYLDTQTNERGGTSQQPTQDSYSDLRYDPNWRTNLRGAGRFDDSPHISAVEYYQAPKEKSSQSCCDREGLIMKGGYRYIVNSCPAVAVTPHLACDESDPYCLHPQNAQTGSATPAHHELQPPSPEADHSKPPCGKNTLKGFRRKSVNRCDNAGENRRSTELTKDATYIQSKAYLLQELRSTQGGTTQIQQISTSKYPKFSLNKKLESLAEDIVERNKMTLGRNSSKRGSYVSVHALKQERPHKVNKPNSQKTSSSQPLLPSIHLNIHLNTSHLHPFIQRGGQDDIINLTPPHWSPPSEVELAFFPGCQQTNHHRILKSSPEQWQRTTALKWPLSCEGEHHKCPTEAHTKPFPQNLPGTPSTTLSPGSGLAVLPPIRESMTGREPEPSPENTESHTDGYRKLRTRATVFIHNACVISVCAEIAYSLKDYKQLKSDIHLRGLGPDYTAAEQTDPEGSDKKVPRMKALEYAKTIAKPVASQTPKQREQRSEGSTERAPYLEGLDHPPPDTLEVLRQRHEEEKQAVALSGEFMLSEARRPSI